MSIESASEALYPKRWVRSVVAGLLLHLLLGYVYLSGASILGFLESTLGRVLVACAGALWLAAAGLIVARWLAYNEPFGQLLKTSLAWFLISAAWFVLVPLLLLAIPVFRSWAGLTRDPRKARPLR